MLDINTECGAVLARELIFCHFFSLKNKEIPNRMKLTHAIALLRSLIACHCSIF